MFNEYRYGDLNLDWDQCHHIGIETDKPRLARDQVLLSVYQTRVILKTSPSQMTSTLKVFLHVTHPLLYGNLFRDGP